MQPHTRSSRTLAACLAVAFAGPAVAENTPYYIGASQTLAYQTNIFSSNTNTIDSGISTTSLLGGFDQPIGRQRVFATANLGYNYYTNSAVSYLNYNSYGVNAGVDWETVERLSGTVRLQADQSLAFYGLPSGPSIVNEQNIQNVGDAALALHYGITPRITLDAGYEFRYLNYSAPVYAYLEYKQNTVNLGLSYGQSGVLKVGLGLRLDKTDYPNYLQTGNPTDPYLADNSTGKHVDLTARWIPTGLSALDARLSFTDISHTVNTGSDYHGLTGALGWNYQPTGKLSSRLELLVTPGTGATYFYPGGATVQNSQLSKILRLNAYYAATGKTTFNGSIGVVQNNYGQSVGFGTDTSTQNGTDLTPSISLGVSYAPSRNSLLSCSASYQKRTASQEAEATGQSYPYDSSNISCSGQITLQ